MLKVAVIANIRKLLLFTSENYEYFTRLECWFIKRLSGLV